MNYEIVKAQVAKMAMTDGWKHVEKYIEDNISSKTQAMIDGNHDQRGFGVLQGEIRALQSVLSYVQTRIKS